MSVEPAKRRSGERGFLMAALAASIAVMVIFSTLAFQEWADVLRRDNEAEMMFRAKDLVRAIQRYRRDHGGVGPQKLEDLMEPGARGQYYLRRLWKDPLVRNGKWGLLYMGPGGIVDPNAAVTAAGLEGGAPGIPQREKFSVFERPEGDKQDSENTPAGPGSSLTPSGSEGQARPTGKPISSDDPAADANAGGKQMSGLPIAGVKSLSKDKPFRVYNGLTEYGEWRFTYLDLETPVAPGGRGGQPRAPRSGAPGVPPGGPRGGPLGRGAQTNRDR